MKKMSVLLLSVTLVFIYSVTPFVCNANALSARAYTVMIADTQEVLFSQNENMRLPMASTTKIMTALILAEQKDLSKTFKITKEMVAVEGSSMGLLPGDIVSLKDLLYGMLLASGNDAANATAFFLAGGLKEFAEKMNTKAAQLGMKNTHFVTPSGLDDENHYTTANDMAILTAQALKNNEFKAACSSQSATLYYGNPPYKRTLKNHNKLLSLYDGLIGVKTGFTKKSGRCLVTAAQRDGKTVIAVTLNDPNDWQDHIGLLGDAFATTTTLTFSNDDIADSVPVINGDCDRVSISAKTAKICVSNKNSGNIKRKVLIPEFVYSSLSAGEKIGEIRYYLNGKNICTTDIISVADVHTVIKKKEFSKKFYEKFLLLIRLII